MAAAKPEWIFKSWKLLSSELGLILKATRK